jgi:SMODS-associating 4TM effector domain
MAKTGESIVEKENLGMNIERLAAQKEMYFRAKRLFYLQFIVTVLVTIILAVIGLALPHLGNTIDWNWVRATYGVLAAVADVFLLNHFINQLRQRAASVQELFDCDVLDVEWNKVCVGEKPPPEAIRKYADKHLKRIGTYDKLINWYAEAIREVDGPAAKVICQRSNFSYDSAIRKSFVFCMSGLSIVVILVSFLIALALNTSTRSLFTLLILPVLPILTFLVKLIKENVTSIKNVESLNSHITTLWTDVLSDAARNVEKTLRQIQDRIYLNRKSSPLIPEWFYDWQRPSLEKQMLYGVDDLVDQYKKRLS